MKTMPRFVTEEIEKAIRRGKTFEVMLDYLPQHVGETITCADLRKQYPEISSHVLARWLSNSSWALGMNVRVNYKAATIKPEKPIEIDNWDGTKICITEYKVNSYTILGER